MTLLVGVDLGKTRCRMALSDGVRRLAAVEVAGARGLADPGGVVAAYDAVVSAWTQARHQAGVDPETTIDVVLVGAAAAQP